MRRGGVRDACVEALERQIEQFRDGRDDAIPDSYLTRLDALVGGFTVVLPGSLVGPVLEVPVVDRPTWYRIHRDRAVPVRPARDCARGRAGYCVVVHDHWEEVPADDVVDEAAGAAA